ncbi:hypothetical protein JOB18_046447 [Solea senegalensis]|uniref:Uncharacterized protein n=1 Tax=Solea senegalensis TaxID=28829 RepID=A0AAV6QNM4_SOLSE|nr:hypothetical protein JOB18_046447 [Solea senegalensis]
MAYAAYWMHLYKGAVAYLPYANYPIVGYYYVKILSHSCIATLYNNLRCLRFSTLDSGVKADKGCGIYVKDNPVM